MPVEGGTVPMEAAPMHQDVPPAAGSVAPRRNYTYTSSNKGMLARMWDVEQRKNAWLKRTFLN